VGAPEVLVSLKKRRSPASGRPIPMPIHPSIYPAIHLYVLNVVYDDHGAAGVKGNY